MTLAERLASIRPQIFVCGNLGETTNSGTNGWRFNSATDFCLWKSSIRDGEVFAFLFLLQFGHRFLSVEMQHSWADVPGNRRLQFGHRFLSVEMLRSGRRRNSDRGASIRPQIFVCGNVSGLTRKREAEQSFNSATDFCLWKYGAGVCDANGCFWASIRPQIFVCGNPILFRRDGVRGTASIRPQIFVCGNHVSLSCSLALYGGFNSATDFCLWKLERNV
ncbi:unnamed protein product [Tuwongella immobilis]|uniref:Uncharacterized protein n=1 Tax=Tuwongella immobilis TaxID=692036 RepID=A0A6C2YV25_9BACT|nr:unnamed protein product [Tuwongella immobilis]VTS07790.1 unnamed protein product [Tuwongella immobilis]